MKRPTFRSIQLNSEFAFADQRPDMLTSKSRTGLNNKEGWSWSGCPETKRQQVATKKKKAVSFILWSKSVARGQKGRSDSTPTPDQALATCNTHPSIPLTTFAAPQDITKEGTPARSGAMAIGAEIFVMSCWIFSGGWKQINPTCKYQEFVFENPMYLPEETAKFLKPVVMGEKSR